MIVMKQIHFTQKMNSLFNGNKELKIYNILYFAFQLLFNILYKIIFDIVPYYFNDNYILILIFIKNKIKI